MYYYSKMCSIILGVDKLSKLNKILKAALANAVTNINIANTKVLEAHEALFSIDSESIEYDEIDKATKALTDAIKNKSDIDNIYAITTLAFANETKTESAYDEAITAAYVILEEQDKHIQDEYAHEEYTEEENALFAVGDPI